MPHLILEKVKISYDYNLTQTAGPLLLLSIL